MVMFMVIRDIAYDKILQTNNNDKNIRITC